MPLREKLYFLVQEPICDEKQLVFQDVKSKNYQKSLLKRLECALNPDMSNGETHEVDENHITKQVKQLKQKMPKQLCIYIAGSSKFYHKQTDEICKWVSAQQSGSSTVCCQTTCRMTDMSFHQTFSDGWGRS